MKKAHCSSPLLRDGEGPRGWGMGHLPWSAMSLDQQARLLLRRSRGAAGITKVRMRRENQPPISGERATCPFLRASFFFFAVGFSVFECRSPEAMVAYVPASRTAPSCTPALTRLLT